MLIYFQYGNILIFDYASLVIIDRLKGKNDVNE